LVGTGGKNGGKTKCKCGIVIFLNYYQVIIAFFEALELFFFYSKNCAEIFVFESASVLKILSNILLVLKKKAFSRPII